MKFFMMHEYHYENIKTLNTNCDANFKKIIMFFF
jgi:hypothetical protein